MDAVLSLAEIRELLDHVSARYNAGEIEHSMAEVARRACISKQTLYAVWRDDRSQFGRAAQIYLSRALGQIMEEIGAIPSRRMRVVLGASGPRLRFGTMPPGRMFTRQG